MKATICFRSVAALFIFLSIALRSIGQSLERSVPEAEGISSAAIVRFLDAAEKSKTEFHSFMLLRHGKVIAEGWWNPYQPQLKHTLYSCSKSFTATAVGFAVQEHLLSLSDKIISFFPNDLPDSVSSYLTKLTVKDALMMSDGQDPDVSFTLTAKDSNWVKGFLATPIMHEPGTQFLYNSLGTYMLSAIVQKVSGQKTIDYLKPRLFDPLGIHGEDWETDIKGINTGGWGLRLRTEDMAKFAQLFLQKGNWMGKQVLSPAWVQEASTVKIIQDPNASPSERDSSDWLQGYCYQMWRCRHNAYRGDGAYGQFILVMPDQDAAIAITAESPNMQEEINLIWQYLLPAFKNESLPANKAAYTALQTKEHGLSLPPPVRGAKGINVNGKMYRLSDNDLHLRKLSFECSKRRCTMRLETDTATYSIDCTEGKWKEATTDMPEPSLTEHAIEKTSLLYPARIVAGYSWMNDSTLRLSVRYIESPHTETFTCHFQGNGVKVEVTKSFDFGSKRMVIEGKQDGSK